MGEILASILLRLRWLAGRLLNELGLPGFVRECQYEAGICKARICVRQTDAYTIINVNGLDVYFRRLTGQIDGVGFSPISHCTPGSVQQSTDFGDEPFGQPPQVHN